MLKSVMGRAQHPEKEKSKYEHKRSLEWHPKLSEDRVSGALQRKPDFEKNVPGQYQMSHEIETILGRSRTVTQETKAEPAVDHLRHRALGVSMCHQREQQEALIKPESTAKSQYGQASTPHPLLQRVACNKVLSEMQVEDRLYKQHVMRDWHNDKIHALMTNTSLRGPKNEATTHDDFANKHPQVFEAVKELGTNRRETARSDGLNTIMMIDRKRFHQRFMDENSTFEYKETPSHYKVRDIHYITAQYTENRGGFKIGMGQAEVGLKSSGGRAQYFHLDGFEGQEEKLDESRELLWTKALIQADESDEESIGGLFE